MPIKSTLCDRTISFTWTKRYFRDEEDSGFKFLDLSNISHTKKLHHFRSSSIKVEEDFVKNCWKKCLDKTNLIPAYKVVINDKEMFLDTLHYFKRFFSNTTNKENLTTDNKKSSSTCVSTQNPDCVSGCIIMKKVDKESGLSETQKSTENMQLPLDCTNETFNERLNNSKLNTSTQDFTLSVSLHESTPLKTAAQKLKDLTELHHEEDIIEFNQHNAIGSKSDKEMSNTAKILQKIIGDDPLVFLFNKARKF